MIMKCKEYLFCLAGKSELAVYGLDLCLKYLDKKQIRVLYNEKDDPEPGIDTWQPSLLKAARKKDIKIISIEEFYKLENIIFLSLEFCKIINPNKFSNSDLFNIHFSYLPSYKGMYTSALPIINNELETGVTLHKIDSGIDTGDIIDQIKFKIENNFTARDLYFKYLFYSKELLKNNLQKILKRKIISYPQPTTGSSYYSSKSIDYNNLKIELNATAERIRNQIRAFFFPEYQVAKIHGYFVNSSKILSNQSKNKPGQILKVSKDEIIITTLDYDLNLYRDKTSELFEAAKNNHIQEASECINSKIDINKRLGKNGFTPLIIASQNNSHDVLKMLIKNGADINRTCYKGITPLIYAVLNYRKTTDRLIYDFLISQGAKMELKDIYQKTLYDYIKENNTVGLLKNI